MIVIKKNYIVRTENNKIKYYKQHKEISKVEKILFIINYRKDNLKIEKGNFNLNLEQNEEEINSINNYIWYVINSVDNNDINENEDYYLSENNILKFGKVNILLKKCI